MWWCSCGTGCQVDGPGQGWRTVRGHVERYYHAPDRGDERRARIVAWHLAWRAAVDRLQRSGDGSLPGAADLHTYIRTYVHTYMRTCVHTYIPTCIRTCMYAYLVLRLPGDPECVTEEGRG